MKIARQAHARLSPVPLKTVLVGLIPRSSNRASNISSISRSMSAMAEQHVGEVFFLDDFASRQWEDAGYSGAHIDVPKAEFVQRVHNLYAEVHILLKLQNV